MNPRLLQRETIFSMRSFAFNSAIPKLSSVMHAGQGSKFERNQRPAHNLTAQGWNHGLPIGRIFFDLVETRWGTEGGAVGELEDVLERIDSVQERPIVEVG